MWELVSRLRIKERCIRAGQGGDPKSLSQGAAEASQGDRPGGQVRKDSWEWRLLSKVKGRG